MSVWNFLFNITPGAWVTRGTRAAAHTPNPRAACQHGGEERAVSSGRQAAVWVETVGVDPTISTISPSTTQTKDSPPLGRYRARRGRSSRTPKGACFTPAPRSPSANSRNHNGPKVEKFAPPLCLFTTVALKVVGVFLSNHQQGALAPSCRG